MEFSKNKIFFLVACLLFIIGAFIMASISYSSQTTQELERFYKKHFSQYLIDKVIKIPYSNGRGSYTLFTSRERDEYFPVLLDTQDRDQYELFREGSIVYKDSNSLDLTLINKEGSYQIRIRDPKDESDESDILLGFFFFGSIFIIALFMPNRVFENLVEGRID